MSGSSLLSSLGAALQAISSSSSRLTSSFRPPVAGSRSHPVLDAFEADLVAQLETLNLPSTVGTNKEEGEEGEEEGEGGGGNFLCMPWLCRAMAVVVNSHSNVEAFIPDLRRDLSDGSNSNMNKWLDEYLDDNVRLLDMCNALKETLKEAKRIHLFAQLAFDSLQGETLAPEILASKSLSKTLASRTLSKTLGSKTLSKTLAETLASRRLTKAKLLRAKVALYKYSEAIRKKRKEEEEQVAQKRLKLDYCASMLRRIGERLTTVEDSSTSHSFSVALHSAQAVTVFVFGVLAFSLSLKSGRFPPYYPCPSSACALSLGTLHQRVKEQVDKKKLNSYGYPSVGYSPLEDLEKLSRITMRLQEIINRSLNAKQFPLGIDESRKIVQTVESLRHCSNGLDEGLTLLERQIEDLYLMLIGRRMVLLDIPNLS